MTLSIVIPIYNEAQTLNTIIKRIHSTSLPDNVDKEIVIVNDGSTDDTAKLLDKYLGDPSIKIFHKNKNEGKTSAVIMGIKNASGNIILIQDADLEYHPEAYSALIKSIVSGEASVVYGSRFKGTIKGMTLINRVANIISTTTFNLLFSTHLTDVNTCYKVFSKRALNDIIIQSRNFGFDIEITAKLTRKGHRIHEIPIQYVARSRREGKKMNWPLACQLYWGIIRYRFHA